MYFKSVLPKFVEAALNYLKLFNPFYSDALINLEKKWWKFGGIKSLTNDGVNSDEMCVVPKIYNDSNTLEIAPGENNSPLSFFNDEFLWGTSIPFFVF